MKKVWKELSNLSYTEKGPETSALEDLVNFNRDLSELMEEMKMMRKGGGGKEKIAFGQSLRPHAFLNSTSRINNQYGESSAQQDVQEFLVFVINTLEETVTKTKALLSLQHLVLLSPSLYFLSPSPLNPEPNTSTSETERQDSTECSTNVKKRSRDPNSLPFDHDESTHVNSGSNDILNNPSSSKRPKTEEDGKESENGVKSENGLESNKKVSEISEIGPKSNILLGEEAKNSSPKQTSLEAPTEPSFVSSEISLASVDRAVYPTSQEMMGEFELVYEDSPPKENSQRTSIYMDTDSPLPSTMADLRATGTGGTIMDFMPEPKESMEQEAEEKRKRRSPLFGIPNFPHELFRGEMRSTFQCLECEKESGPRPDAFYDISVAIEKERDLNWSLNDYFSKTLLCGREKYDCSSCKVLNEANNYTRITQLPEILTIHLKRFSWSSSSLPSAHYGAFTRSLATGGSKLSFHIDCPFNLYIPRRWISNDLLLQILSPNGQINHQHDGVIGSNECRMTNSSMSIGSYNSTTTLSKSALLRLPDDPVASYSLYAVIYHTGTSTTHGHYSCAVRLPQEDCLNILNEPSWAHFDDHIVSIVSHTRVLSTLSSETQGSSTAYILFYKREGD